MHREIIRVRVSQQLYLRPVSRHVHVSRQKAQGCHVSRARPSTDGLWPKKSGRTIRLSAHLSLAAISFRSFFSSKTDEKSLFRGHFISFSNSMLSLEPRGGGGCAKFTSGPYIRAPRFAFLFVLFLNLNCALIYLFVGCLSDEI